MIYISEKEIEEFKAWTLRHLCNTCTKEFAICISNPTFGYDIGNDNVVSCVAYIKNDNL